MTAREGPELQLISKTADNPQKGEKPASKPEAAPSEAAEVSLNPLSARLPVAKGEGMHRHGELWQYLPFVESGQISLNGATICAQVAKLAKEGLLDEYLTPSAVFMSCMLTEDVRQGRRHQHMTELIQLELGMPRAGAESPYAAQELMQGHWPWRLVDAEMMGTSGTEASRSLWYVRGFGRKMEKRFVASRSDVVPAELSRVFHAYTSGEAVFDGESNLEMDLWFVEFSNRLTVFLAESLNQWLEAAAGIPAMTLPFGRPITKDSVDFISTFLVTACFTMKPMDLDQPRYGIKTFVEPQLLMTLTGIPVHSRHRQSLQADGESGAVLAYLQGKFWELRDLLDAYPEARAVLHLNWGGQGNGDGMTRDGRSAGDDLGICCAAINIAAEVVTGDFIDRDGAGAAKGEVIPEMFRRLCGHHHHIVESGAKKAGNEMWKRWLKDLCQEFFAAAGSDPDARMVQGHNILATVTEFVAMNMVRMIDELIAPVIGVPEVVELSGGGPQNSFLRLCFEKYWRLRFSFSQQGQSGQNTRFITFAEFHAGSGCRNDSKEELLCVQLSQMGSIGRGGLLKDDENHFGNLGVFF